MLFFMERSLLLIIITLTSIICSCQGSSEKKSDLNKELLPSFDYLIGDWIRINNQEDQLTYESWEKLSDINYVGIGFTLENSDTIFKENMTIKKQLGIWAFNVSGVNERPTPFLITEHSENSFTCTNEGNAFPKKIVYSLDDSLLNVVISADSMAVLFHFTPTK